MLKRTKYRMEIDLVGRLFHNRYGGMLMESASTIPIVINGDDVEDIFKRIQEMREFIYGKEKDSDGTVSIRVS